MSSGERVLEKTSSAAYTQLAAALGLAGLCLLGAYLRLYHLGASGVGNAYYAAAVKSMLTSWSNFFFVAFEPGGSVSVDKPPVGLWAEALSAALLGLNGFALALPNALAGVAALPLLYALVKRPFGRAAGLTAALALAVTPVTVATERNNTMDGLLVFVLLLAAWAFQRAAAGGRLRLLLVGAGLIGLAFNIKMLQAYMVLPALYALYLLGARHPLGQRLVHLGAATAVLAAVSLSWALVVDAVPAASRPFIGSSTDNTVMELIVGHNGIKRLWGATDGGTTAAASRSGDPSEVGTPGLARLLTEPLAAQASWLLPLALLGLALALGVLGRPWPLTEQHQALILWAGWLLPMLAYFTFTSGLWHTYYLIMLGPALAALVGAAVWALAQIRLIAPGWHWRLAALLSGLTVAFALFILASYPAYFRPAAGLLGLLWVTGLAWLWARPAGPALGWVLASCFVGPLLWSALTTLNPQPEVDLPKAGPEPGQIELSATLNATQQKVLAYLLAETDPAAYLVATVDSHGASPFILAAGRPVLTFGGYIGKDEVISVDQLAAMVTEGRLRFVLDNHNLSAKPAIFDWVSTHCQLAAVPGVQSIAVSQSAGGGPRDQQFAALYDCGR